MQFDTTLNQSRPQLCNSKKKAHQKYRVDTEASHSNHLRIRERISGETWGPEMVKEVYLLSADVQDYFRTL